MLEASLYSAAMPTPLQSPRSTKQVYDRRDHPEGDRVDSMLTQEAMSDAG